MRIISGKLKGRLLNFLKNSNTRPLKDSVRENIFNILNHSSIFKTQIEKSYVLDLYSGIGSFGIECISRGAEKVTFIEQNFDAINTLKENLRNLSIFEKSIIYEDKIENVLSKLTNMKFNFFFLDPPFSDEKYFHNLELIKKNKLYDKNHLVIIHRERHKIDESIKILKILDNKYYGRSRIIFGTFV